MSITPFTIPLDEKMEWLRAKLKSLLDAHGYATFNVHKFVTMGMLGLASNYDVKNVFGKPVAWCRIAPIDMEDNSEITDDEVDVGGSQVIQHHTFSVLIQYQFAESDSYDGSTFDQWNKLLFNQGPAPGVLKEFATLGAEVVGSENQVVQIERPESIAIPEYPVAFYATEDETLVHHCDFRITLI